MRSIMLLAGVWLALGESAAQAQTSSAMAMHGTSTTRMHRDRFFPGMGGYGGDVYGGYGDVATTPLQGIAYGYAKVIDATGKAAKNDAEAAKNSPRSTVTTWRIGRGGSRPGWRSSRSIARPAPRTGRPLTPADYVRMAQVGKPRRLTPSQLNLLTGELAWPIVLESRSFAAYRRAMDGLFAERSEHGRLNAEQYADARRPCKRWATS